MKHLFAAAIVVLQATTLAIAQTPAPSPYLPANFPSPKGQHSPAATPRPSLQPESRLVKRVGICGERSNGSYCGDSGDAQLYECDQGFIKNVQTCSNGCDSSRNLCNSSSSSRNAGGAR